jgi:hypothetical protein
VQLPENARDRVAVLVLTTANPTIYISALRMSLMFYRVVYRRDIVRMPARPDTHS